MQACLVAIYEVKSARSDFCRLPDLAQPSVHHNPIGTFTGKVKQDTCVLAQCRSVAKLDTAAVTSLGVAHFRLPELHDCTSAKSTTL